ncbi:hypothetical protein ACFQY0_02820 [Haloferula chungangensis]|uniref:Uncharacterized protein n=1 Tax=Haloferula chungangensis TaxID=1048331 RepID=A0ABW2L171_9BACT
MSAFLAACGNEGSEAAAPAPAPQQGFQQKSGDLFDDDSDKMIGRYAKTNPMMQKGGEKAAEEGSVGANKFFEGEIAKRDFAAKDYTKKSFWGSKDYEKKIYGGDTDGSRFQQGSRYNSQGALENTMTSSASGSRYATGTHATGAAREGGESNVTKYSNAHVDARQSSFEQPEITDWKSQRGLTIDDTKSMLGR